jgi:hypothetical protein
MRGHTLWYSLCVCTLWGKVPEEPGSVEGGLEEGRMHSGMRIAEVDMGGGGGMTSYICGGKTGCRR